MLVLNFSHPITTEQKEQIAALTGQAPQVVDLKVQLDFTQPIPAQIAAIVQSAGLTAEEWQITPFLVNMPGFNSATAVLTAELHGRCGYFPPIILLAKREETTPTVFDVVSIINLQNVRDAARLSR